MDIKAALEKIGFRLDCSKRLVVSETPSSTWHYHLREVVPGHEKYGGAAGPALCGHELGWDTKVPIGAYVPGRKSHHPGSFCKKCYDLAVNLGYKLGLPADLAS